MAHGGAGFRIAAVATMAIALVGCGSTAPGMTPSPVPSEQASPAGSAATSPVSDETDGDTTALSVSVSPVATGSSVDSQPEGETVVEAAGPDGSHYRLDIPAFALAAPAAITLRPLSGANIPGATFLAGVEIEPSGLRLRLPASLTLSPAVMADTRTAVSLAYSGKESPRAVLGARGAALAAGTHSILLTHFSGGLVAGLDASGESLWLQQGTFNTDTRAGRQAEAEHAIRVLEWAEQQGRISHDEATSSKQTWMQQWLESQIEALQQDPKLQSEIASGDIEQAGDVEAALAGIAQKVLELGNQGNEGPFAEAMAKVIALEGTFARNVIDHLQNDPTFQQKLDLGLVSNMDDVRAVLDAMFGIERSQDIIGDSATSRLIHDTLVAWFKRFVASVLASCKEAPLDASLAAGFIRMAQELGDTGSAAALSDCVWEGAWLLDVDGTLKRTIELGAASMDVNATYTSRQILLKASGGAIAASGSITVSGNQRLFGEGKLICTWSIAHSASVQVTGSREGAELALRLQLPYEPLTMLPSCPGLPKGAPPPQKPFSSSDPIWAEVLQEIRLPADGGTRKVSRTRTLGPQTDVAAGTFTVTVVLPP